MRHQISETVQAELVEALRPGLFDMLRTGFDKLSPNGFVFI
jgi:hypothetical protein